MVEIKMLATKYAPLAAAHSRGVKRTPRLKRDHGPQPEFLKRRSGRLKRGAEIDLLNMNLEDLNVIVTSLRNSSNTALRLYNRPFGSDGEFEPIRFRPSDPTTCAALQRFSRALVRAVRTGGWVQELELGFLLSRQDIKVLSQAICCSSTLQHLSLTNSALGDERLQLLARGLCECLPLQVLDLSGCALTDSSITSVISILKVGVRRMADTEWRLSLRESGGSRLKRRTPRLKPKQGLVALDLSFNMFSDATSRQLCDVLRLGATLEALNLQGNQLRKKSAQMYLVVYQIWGLPRLVDLRKNLDGTDVGVLEDGKHLRSFSSGYAPFWNASLLGSPIQNLPEQDRNPSSQRQKLGPRDNHSRGPLVVRDPAKSGDISSEKIPVQNLSSKVEQGTREHPNQGILASWSTPTSQFDLSDASPQERESTAREERLSEPHGDDQRLVQVSIKPLSPSLCLGDRVDQSSPLSCTKAGEQITSSPILDIRKEYSDSLETKNRKSGSDVLYGDLCPLPNDQSSDQLGESLPEGQSRPLSPILDPATPELTNRKHPKKAANMENQDRTDLRDRTSDEFTSSSCLRAARSVDDDSRNYTPKFDLRQSPNFACRSQPTEWKMRHNVQIYPKQLSSGDHKRGNEKLSKMITNPKLGPGKESGHRQNRSTLVSSQNLKRKQSARPSQHLCLHSTSECQREESEWGSFMWEMARSLIHLQEGLDLLMESSTPNAEFGDDGAATELHKLFAASSS